MVRIRKLLPIRSQIYRLFFIFSAVLICIVIWSSLSFISLQQNSLNSYLKLYSVQLAETTEEAYTSFENIAYSVAYNTTVQEFITETDPAARYELYRQVYNLLNNTAKLNSGIVDIAVISPSGNSVSLEDSPALYEEYLTDISSSSSSFLSLGTKTIRGSSCHVLAMPSHLLKTSGENSYLGTVFLSISIDRLFAPRAEEENDILPEVVLLDSSCRVICGDPALAELLTEETQETFTCSCGGITYRGKKYTIAQKDWNLYVLFDSSAILQSSLNVTVKIILVLVILAILILLFLLASWIPFSNSLRQLSHIMRNITQGKQETLRNGIDLTDIRFGCTEIREIYDSFNSMLRQVNELNSTVLSTYTQMYELEMNNRQTEIAFLRSQINPHFLYNTLTTICGLSSGGHNEKIIEVAGALSSIFRYSIQGSDMVPLKEELKIVRSYLMIQTCRFGDRFRILYEIREDTLDCRIPKMIIQPLVENAIVHGLEPSTRPGNLIIGSALSPDKKLLILSVTDTGVGMPPQKLDRLKDAMEQSIRDHKSAAAEHLQRMDEAAHDSIGLLNVNSRIVLCFGKAYALKLNSWEGSGTEIQIRIPFGTDTDKKEESDVPRSHY